MLFSGIAAGSLADAPAPDWQLIRLDPKILLASQPAIAIPIYVNARSFQYGRDSHAVAFEHRGETVDKHLVLVQLHLAQTPLARRPGLGRHDQLSPYRAGQPGLDREPGGSP